MPPSKAERGTASATRHVRKTFEMPALRKLSGRRQADGFFLLIEILSGDPARSIEAAKQLVALPENTVPLGPLARIVSDSSCKDWSRIAAAYVLGFAPSSGPYRQVLRKVLIDRSDSSRVRCHAAESLGNLRDSASFEELRSTLFDQAESTSLRKWCIYALGEIGSRSSREALRKFDATKPQGILAKELALACESFHRKTA